MMEKRDKQLLDTFVWKKKYLNVRVTRRALWSVSCKRLRSGVRGDNQDTTRRSFEKVNLILARWCWRISVTKLRNFILAIIPFWFVNFIYHVVQGKITHIIRFNNSGFALILKEKLFLKVLCSHIFLRWLWRFTQLSLNK